MNDVVRGRWAGAFDNADFLCVETYSGYRGGVRDHKGKQHLLGPDVSDEILGAALLDAMAHSRFYLHVELMFGSIQRSNLILIFTITSWALSGHQNGQSP
jgi:hypothetical protein